MLKLKELKDLNRAVDLLFLRADELGVSNAELSREAGLCYATVSNLDRRITMYPRANTVFALAKAVGMRVTLEPAKVRLHRATG